MPLVSGINDSYIIQAVAKIKENLAIWTGGKWRHYRIDFLETLPPGPANVIDMVANAAQTQIAAGAIIQKRGIPFLQLGSTEMAQLRWEPLDDVEGLLWEQPGQLRCSKMRMWRKRRYLASMVAKAAIAASLTTSVVSRNWPAERNLGS